MNFEKLKENGAAPTLAIFLILIVISSALVIAQLQSSEERKVSSIQLLMASDETSSTLSSINSDLEGSLETALPAAMQYAGERGGSVEDVEDYVSTYLENRVEEGWDYGNINENVPLNENSIIFRWQPNGSLLVTLKLNTVTKHVKGPSAYGTYIKASTFARFKRLKQLTEQLNEENYSHLDNDEEMKKLEGELNENYRCEGIEVNLYRENSQILAEVRDIYGGAVAITD